MKKIYITHIAVLLSLICSSCSDFLEESSQDLMVVKSVKDYKELFFGEVINNSETLHPYLEYMTDNVSDLCYYGSSPFLISNDWREPMWAYYTWQQDPEVGISNEFTADNAWTSYYHKILMSNIVLDEISKMTGTEEERSDLAGEAYFMRAYSYFMLANLYGQPYEPATAATDLCVPVNDEISLSDKQLSRSTNAEVYSRMERDIDQAIQHLKISGSGKTIFRPNLPSAYLLASRIYLFEKKYEQAALYSDSVITIATQGLNNLRLLDKKADDYVFLSYTNKEILFSYGTTNFLNYMRDEINYQGNLIVSSDLMNLYDENDLRPTYFYHHIVGTQRSPVKKTIEFYIPWKWYSTSPTVNAKAFRLSEAYLNRAEAYAELGETQKAMADVNTLRSCRTKVDTPDLSADKKGVVETVREERRRELAFEDFRWFDLRRYRCPVIEHKYTSSATEGAGDMFRLADKKLYTLPVPKSERDKNMVIEIFDRPQNNPVK